MTPSLATCELPITVPYRPMRITVEQYHEMIELGAFSRNERFELLEGVVVEKMTKNPPHVVATRRCEMVLSRLLPAGWHLRSQDPLTLATSEPEPDVVVVRGQLEDYAARHPSGSEVALVVEVADTSLVTDRYKAAIYAAAGIPCYWIINLPERIVEVYSSPTTTDEGSSYAHQRRCSSSDEFAVNLDGQEIGRVQVSELLL